MLRFQFFGFPVEVQWHFWLMAAIFSGVGSVEGVEGLQLLVISVAIIFVSILIHELGHALAMRKFHDRRVTITLYSFGGFAQGSLRQPRMSSLIISAAGPAFSLALGLLGWLVDRAFPVNHWLAVEAVDVWLWVNFGWTILNLLPVLPLDGGHILEAALGPFRLRATLIVSAITAAGVAAFAATTGRWITVIFFAMLAVQSWQQLNNKSPSDWMRP
ncbi:MAG: site-2 protease family protein [Verrucomicrobiaceae bacterium]|nr:site-2 protease family protein [Verrucomicrobiaceae bacterium]